MARYVLIAFLASGPITYLYETEKKALAKARTLQRSSATFELKDGATDAPMTIEELEARLRAR